MFGFLDSTLVYPALSKRIGDQGTVYVSFVVDTKGKISEIEVIRGISKSLDNEAVRVVKLMPDWKSGSYEGKPADFRYRLPIKFTLK